jgi:hypothetical protein
MQAGGLELRVADGGMRWKIQPYAPVEVWNGPVLIGTLSGAALCLIVEHYLSLVTVQATVTAELDWARRPRPVTSPRRMPPRPIINKPALRAARRSRKRS